MRICSVCDREYSREEPWRRSCGEPLDYATQPLPESRPDQFSRTSGVWDFADFHTMDEQVSLGEGWTPLVDAPEWDATFKLEYLHPTGSFKDRGAATVIAEALEVGADRVLEDSSGNAGLAVASYAARAGLDAEIYVPADAKEAKRRRIERTGADVVPVEGSRESVTAACIDAVESGAGWYASHAWNPAFFAGTATAAYEIAAQRDWTVPDAVVTPLGHGTLFLGAYLGFRALCDAGWTDRMPKLLGAQAAGYAPIAAEVHGEIDVNDNNEIADGIQIREPVQKARIMEAIDRTDGDTIALSERAVATELDRLHESGFYTEQTCAVAPAALREYRERGVVEPDDDVVVPLTGSGLKG
jgi:threonine synthase